MPAIAGLHCRVKFIDNILDHLLTLSFMLFGSFRKQQHHHYYHNQAVFMYTCGQVLHQITDRICKTISTCILCRPLSRVPGKDAFHHYWLI